MAIDLRHKGCGGFYTPLWTQGHNQGFRCEKCQREVAVPYRDDESDARRDDERARWQAKMAAWGETHPPEPPRPPIRKASIQEALVLGAYSAWSEDAYAASFMAPDTEHVAMFRRWLERRQVEADYEDEMLRLWDAAE